MPGRVFSREFKLTVVRQVANGEKRPAQVCREHQLGESLLARWRKEYEARGEAAFASHQEGEPTSPGAAGRRVRAVLRSVGAGEPHPKGGIAGRPIAERRAMITEAQAAYPQVSLRHLCALFDVNRAWYYAARREGREDAQETALRDAIERIVLDFPGYGYRRVTKALQRAGRPVNHKRVLRVMREESLLCQLKRRFVATTDSAHGYRTYPNLLAGAVLDGLQPEHESNMRDDRHGAGDTARTARERQSGPTCPLSAWSSASAAAGGMRRDAAGSRICYGFVTTSRYERSPQLCTCTPGMR